MTNRSYSMYKIEPMSPEAKKEGETKDKKNESFSLEKGVHFAEFDLDPETTTKPKYEYIKAKLFVLQEWVWNVFEQDVPTRLGKVVNMSLIALIVISLMFFIIGTEPYFQIPEIEWTIFGMEYIIAIIFLLEWILRLITCTASQLYGTKGSILGRLKFMISIGSVVDILAIAPSLVTLNWILIACMAGQCYHKASPNDVLPVRNFVAIRVLRFLRIGKLERHFKAVDLIKTIIVDKFNEIMLAGLIIMVSTMGVATVMWYAEAEAQPDEFGSIIRSFYFTFMTLSTIGYGDVVPTTLFGKIAATVTSLIAIFLFAMPTSILGSALIEQFERKRQNQQEVVKKKMQIRQRRIAIQNKRAKLIRQKILTKEKELERKPTLIRQDSVVSSGSDISQQHSEVASVVDSVVSSGSDNDDEVSSSHHDMHHLANKMVTNEPMGHSTPPRHLNTDPVSDDEQHQHQQMGSGNMYGCPHCGKGIGVRFTTGSGDAMPLLPTSTPTLGQFNEESPEELWDLFKKHRGGITLKEFQRGMKEHRSIDFSKDEVMSMMEDVGVRGYRITHDTFIKMMAFEEGGGTSSNDNVDYAAFGI